MVSFGFYELINGENKFKHFCGGAIVGSNLVITAAKCFFNPDVINNNQVVIRAGDECHNTTDDNATAKDYEINEITRPYLCNEYNRQLNDVAFVYTKYEFEFNDCTKKVCLPQAPEDNMAADSAVILNGWGFENGTYSRVNYSLKKARNQTFSKDHCASLYSQNTWYGSDIHLCTGDQVNTNFCFTLCTT